MSNLSRVNEMLLSVGRRDGLKNFQLAQNGCTSLKLVDGTCLSFELNDFSAAFFIYTPLMKTPESQHECVRLFTQLLRLNCLSAGPVIAMHPSQPQIILQIALDVSTLTANKIDDSIGKILSQKESILRKTELGNLKLISSNQKEKQAAGSYF